jgi:phenylacetic acid degradation operon negative regulatory protein
VKARTEELLYYLLWNAEKLCRPTFRNLTDSYECWAYRKGFLRHIQQLEARKLVERESGNAADAIYRLSESGRLVALGGCDPVAEWSRRWDGRWRLVLFDLPQAEAHARTRLRRFLKANRFGYLQNSVWISPDPLSKITRKLSESAEDVESLITFEACPAAGESNADIVAGAWNFERINKHYSKCGQVLDELPEARAVDEESRKSLQRWAQMEMATWREAVSVDPLLPTELQPSGYLGRKVWLKRVRVLARAASLLS